MCAEKYESSLDLEKKKKETEEMEIMLSEL